MKLFKSCFPLNIFSLFFLSMYSQYGTNGAVSNLLRPLFPGIVAVVWSLQTSLAHSDDIIYCLKISGGSSSIRVVGKSMTGAGFSDCNDLIFT